eukprot:CAMPEP_0194255838 /NCGR_PEP_ID=MMETSP0158-20130606/35418_1 /TAXON_ID=33649 /ORGANISM="Thalassionema nitzschioides, Strain L26-B" /LENGTH=383 /DNA_ID=CAMNT_0038994323 /DNA_START=185 /DNA_END=1336 /DNA_ORIENTATION=-
MAIGSRAAEVTSNTLSSSDLYGTHEENVISLDGSDLNEIDRGEHVDKDEKILIPHEYFPRKRLRNQDPVPFIFLVPSFSYWNSVGQKLGSRGYSVMICGTCEHEDGPELVKSIFEDRRWKRAVLVGCDKESILAFRAAAELGPEQIAGLILCGDLRTVESEMGNNKKNIGSFVKSHVECPFRIIGGTLSSSDQASTGSDLDELFGRFRGGSLAPYRRRLPEHFAWELTRFLEENIILPDDSLSQEVQYDEKFWSKLYHAGLSEIIGRCSAYLVIFLGIAKVSSYQKESISDTGIRIQKGYVDTKEQLITFVGKAIAIKVLDRIRKKDKQEEQEVELDNNGQTGKEENDVSAPESEQEHPCPDHQATRPKLSDSIVYEGCGINL